MTDSKYATSITLNNQGAQHFQNGCFLKAVQLFHLALDTLSDAMVLDHTDDSEDDVEAMNSLEKTAVTFEWSSKPSSQQNDDEETFVFRRALIMLPTRSTPIKLSEEGYADESSAILYNLGLSYHLHGLKGHSQFLHTAISFYEFALEVAETRIHNLFGLAASNNLGHVHHEMFNFERSLQCFAHVFEELQCVSQPMDACDYNGFLLNLTLEAPSAAPSA